MVVQRWKFDVQRTNFQRRTKAENETSKVVVTAPKAASTTTPRAWARERWSPAAARRWPAGGRSGRRRGGGLLQRWQIRAEFPWSAGPGWFAPIPVGAGVWTLGDSWRG